MNPRWLQEPPYPERIIDSTGSCFSFGVIGGTAFHFLKGIYNSPPKGGTRFMSGTQAIITKFPPPIGGRIAVWAATVHSLECAMIYARQKEDPWNEIIAGFTAGGLFAMRYGLRPAMLQSVLFGGLYALIRGSEIMSERSSARGRRALQPVQLYDPPPPPGLFYGGYKWKWTPTAGTAGH